MTIDGRATRRGSGRLSAAALLLLSACSGQQTEGLNEATLPVSLRSDYEVFSIRCSKCHSLSRPLNSGITDMEHWRNYVRRMRLQPDSGIAPSDVAPILRFLDYYSNVLHGRTGGT